VFAGRVLRVGAASDAQSKQFPIEVELPNQDRRLLPGMVATVELEFTESGDRIVIPRDAAVDEFGMRSVFVVEASAGEGGDIARRRRVVVRPLPFRPSELEVVSGLEAGQQVVVTGVRRLRDGEAVQPTVERAP
jgi:membrane fusion protein (multidrug efflux system)